MPMQPSAEMMSYQNPPIIKKDGTAVPLGMTITPPTMTTTGQRSKRMIAIVAVAGMLMLAGGGTVWMQDALFSSDHATGSINTATEYAGIEDENEHYMDCGDAYLCGVLTLETGLGPGAYRHDFVSVHGLWPEMGSYGSSACIKPSSPADPSKVYSCYDHPGGSGMAPLVFETHEWEKHGTCAGVKDATDFFSQLCSISKDPLEVMDAAKKAGQVDLSGYESRLTSAGYEVFSTYTANMQLMLSACAGDDGKWKLAAVADFSDKCPGGTGPTPKPTAWEQYYYR